MDVSVTEAKKRLPALIRAMEDGETIVITRNGRPVAQLTLPPLDRRQARFDGMSDRIRLLSGWNDPIDLDNFLKGEL